jgi:hypothetical protein
MEYQMNLFNDLFAHRLDYMDYNQNENDIIRYLKIKLIELGYNEGNLNNILFSFYTYFEIPITLTEIENINNYNYNSNNIYNLLFGNIINYQEPDIEPDAELDSNPDANPNVELDLYNDMPPLEPVASVVNFTNLINILLGGQLTINNVHFEQILVEPLNNNHMTNHIINPMTDVLVTTDENTLNTLNILKITKDMNEKCTICIIDMIEDEEYLDIECKHIFHKDCLETYLKNYNHICPVCRKEIGKSYAHIND